MTADLFRCHPHRGDETRCDLCNLGRGSLVDEAALAAALVSKHLSGAVIDVTRMNPCPKASVLDHTQHHPDPALGRRYGRRDRPQDRLVPRQPSRFRTGQITARGRSTLPRGTDAEDRQYPLPASVVALCRCG
ncbi:MAG: NAD(P)-dependent oxidoreductase [Paracoccaceae bacterium]